jgi:hypothetical protein
MRYCLRGMEDALPAFMTWLARSPAIRFALPVAALALGCGGNDLTLPNEGVAAKIVVVSGDQQEGTVGNALANRLVVRVTDSKDRPVQDQPVTFAPDPGSGATQPITANTDAAWQAQVQWVLGPTAGSQRVVARPTGNGAAAGVQAAFTATASASSAVISANSAQAQQARAGTDVPAPPSVLVKDLNGNGISGVAVTFEVTQGGGAIAPASGAITTDGNGVATLTSWTLGTNPGANQVSASAQGVPGSVVFDATGTPALAISTASPLAEGEVGLSYNSGALDAPGGVTPLQWAVTAGNLPSGLSINGSTGAVTGTPSAAGTTSFTVTVTDALSATASKDFQISIASAVGVTTTTLPQGTVNASYSQTVAASGGKAPYSWTVASGSLPNGLTMSAGGVISGTPTATGTANFSVRVTDALGATDDQALSITVDPAPLIGTTVSVAANATPSVYGQAVTFTATVSGGITPTGDVTFREGGSTCSDGTVLSTNTLNNGSATSNGIGFLTVGSHTIRACYGGDLLHSGNSNTTTQTVNKASTTTTITTDLSTATASTDPLTVEVTVGANAPGAGTPAGSVTISLDTGENCIATLSGGSGSCAIQPPITAGPRTVTAAYAGDGNFEGSTSAGVSHDVTP